MAGWILWGLFARGARWSYWLIGPLAGVILLATGAALIFHDAIRPDRIGLAKGDLFIGAIIGATVGFICLLPRTRRHFYSAGRLEQMKLQTNQ